MIKMCTLLKQNSISEAVWMVVLAFRLMIDNGFLVGAADEDLWLHRSLGQLVVQSLFRLVG